MGNQYDQRNIETMETLYGEGYLSMGGDEEVARIMSPVSVSGKKVLDIGCGLGGASLALARDLDAAEVYGIDIDVGVLSRARELVQKADLGERIQLLQFEPGPFPFEDGSFDLVYLTAVSCHIEELIPFFEEVRRVIRPGGCLLGGEWFRAVDNEAYREWDDMLRVRGLNFYFVTLEGFGRALEAAGFNPVSSIDQSLRVSNLADGYLERVEGELRASLLESLGPEDYAALDQWTRIRASGLAQGGSGYCHFQASCP